MDEPQTSIVMVPAILRLFVVGIIGAAFAACAGTSIAPRPQVQGQALLEPSNGVAQRLYAYSPGSRPLLAWYDSRANNRDAAPLGVLGGRKTGFIPANTGGGVALDARGNVYVLTVDASIGRSTLAIFEPGSSGNAAPKRTLSLGIQAGGLALDGRGNFWTASPSDGTLLRYPLWSRTAPRPNARIVLTLDSPIGELPAYAHSVALDANGDLYCPCALVYHGHQVIGVTEYTIGSKGESKRVRSFYDEALPEVPPSMITVAPDGTIYLASTVNSGGVYWYPGKTHSGEAHNHRFYGPRLHYIASIATDAEGRVYVAEGTHVLVFEPQAVGPYVIQQRTIADRRHLRYPQLNAGSFLFLK